MAKIIKEEAINKAIENLKGSNVINAIKSRYVSSITFSF
jgi:hypothetical protein